MAKERGHFSTQMCNEMFAPSSFAYSKRRARHGVAQPGNLRAKLERIKSSMGSYAYLRLDVFTDRPMGETNLQCSSTQTG